MAVSKCRDWCFTLDNWTLAELIHIQLVQPSFKYVVYGMEIAPSTGTPHLQGYVEYNNPVGFKRVKKDLGLRAHIESRMWPRIKAREYCMKDDLWAEYGTWDEPMGQGHRSDLDAIVELVRSGATKKQIAQEFPGQYIRYGRGIEKWMFDSLDPPPERDVEVKVYWGDSGTGKTFTAMHEDDERPYSLNSNGNGVIWFDGYCGQKTLVIDDYYGWIRWGEFLKILDRNAYRCQIKGESLWANWSKVIITSNLHPEDWYHNIHDLEPMMRRFSSIERFLK